MSPPFKYYYEDYKPGDVIAMGERTVQRDEIIAFAR